MKIDYFEIDRVVEDLAKSYAAPCSATWFKVMNHKKPSHEEYCAKVIDFVKQFENSISSQLPKSIEAALCLEYVKRQLQTQISLFRRGNNKEVKRTKCYDNML
jgi:hypothetical protein